MDGSHQRLRQKSNSSSSGKSNSSDSSSSSSSGSSSDDFEKKFKKKEHFEFKPLYLDDSKVGQGKHKHVVSLPSYKVRVVRNIPAYDNFCRCQSFHL